MNRLLILVSFFFLGVGWDWAHLVHRLLSGLMYQPWMIGDDECGGVGGMRIGRGNQSIWRKPAPVPLCPPQNPHDMTWAWTRAAAVGSWQLTAWAMAGPEMTVSHYISLGNIYQWWFTMICCKLYIFSPWCSFLCYMLLLLH
jgi:hypothetical protein